MRILIATGLYPPDIGGPATILKALAKGLKEKGIDVKIITYADIDSSWKLWDDGGVKVCSVSRKLGRIRPYLYYFFWMWRFSRKADLIYATDIYSVGYFAYLLKKITGKKYIIRFAGDSAWETAVSAGWTKDYIVDFQEKKYGKKIESLKERRKIILVNADRVVAVGYFLAKIAKQIGVLDEKIRIIYNSIDFIEWKESTERIQEIKSQYGKDGKIIITACRLVPWKGVGDIIEILPQLKAKIGPVNFLILGEGPEKEGLKKLAEEKKISENVHFLGRVRHNQVLDYFRAADLFVLNTNYEGLSHTLLEAMKAGAPIITTDVGGNSEVITDGESGILIDYGNQPRLLAVASEILTNYKLAETLCRKAKEKEKRFSWKATVEETADVIKEVSK